MVEPSVYSQETTECHRYKEKLPKSLTRPADRSELPLKDLEEDPKKIAANNYWGMAIAYSVAQTTLSR